MSEVPILKDLTISQITRCQKNGHSWLFVDRIEKVIPGKMAIGYKHFSCNELFFSSHSIDKKYVPNFVVAETLEQVFLMTFLVIPENKGKKTVTVSSDTSFNKQVMTGETMQIRSKLEHWGRGIARGYSEGYVSNEHVCLSKFTVAIPDIIDSFKPKSRGNS